MSRIFNSLCLFILISSHLLAMEFNNPFLDLIVKKIKISIDDESPNEKEEILLDLVKSVVNADVEKIKKYVERYGFWSKNTLIEIERLVKQSEYKVFLEEQPIIGNQLVKNTVTYNYVTKDENNNLNLSNATSELIDKKRSSLKKQARKLSETNDKNNLEGNQISKDIYVTRKTPESSLRDTTELTSSNGKKQPLKKTASGDIIIRNSDRANTFTDSSSDNFWTKSSDIEHERIQQRKSQKKYSDQDKRLLLRRKVSEIIPKKLTDERYSDDEELQKKEINGGLPAAKSPRFSREDKKYKFLLNRSRIKREAKEVDIDLLLTPNTKQNKRRAIKKIKSKKSFVKISSNKDKQDLPEEENTKATTNTDPRSLFRKKASGTILLQFLPKGEINPFDSELAEELRAITQESEPSSHRQQLQKKSSVKFMKPPAKNHSPVLVKRKSQTIIPINYSPREVFLPLAKKPLEINYLSSTEILNQENFEKKIPQTSSNASIISPLKTETVKSDQYLVSPQPFNSQEKKRLPKINKAHEETILSHLAKKQGQNLLASLLTSKEIWESSTKLPGLKWIAEKDEEDPRLLSHPVTEEGIENLIRRWKDSFFFSLYANKKIPDSIHQTMNTIKRSLRKSVESFTEAQLLDGKKEEKDRIKNALLDVTDIMVLEWTLILGQYPKKESFENKSIALSMISDSFFNALSSLRHHIQKSSLFDKVGFETRIVEPMEAVFKDALKALGINNPESLKQMITTIENINFSLSVFRAEGKKNINLLTVKNVSLENFNALFVPFINEIEKIRDLLESDKLEIKNIAISFDKATEFVYLIDNYRKNAIASKAKKIVIPEEISFILHHSLSQMYPIRQSLRNLTTEINKIIDLLMKVNAKLEKNCSPDAPNFSEVNLIADSNINSSLKKQLSEMDKIKNSLIEVCKLGKINNEIINEAANLFFFAAELVEQKDEIKETTVRINNFKKLLFEDVERGDLHKIEIRLFQAVLWHINWLTIINDQRKTLSAIASENGYTEIKKFIEKYYEKIKIDREWETIQRFRDFEFELSEIKKELKELKDPSSPAKNSKDNLTSIWVAKSQKSYFKQQLAEIYQTANMDLSKITDLKAYEQNLSLQDAKIEEELEEIINKVPAENFKIHRQWVLDEVEFPFHQNLIDDNIFSWEIFKSIATAKEIKKSGNTITAKDIEKFISILDIKRDENPLTKDVNKSEGTITSEIGKLKGTLLYSVIQEEIQLYQQYKNWWPEHWQPLWKHFNKQALLMNENEFRTPSHKLKNVASFFKAIADGDAAELDKFIKSGVKCEELQNKKGQTPSEYARNRNHDFIVQFALLSQKHWFMVKLADLKNCMKSKIKQKEGAQKVVSKSVKRKFKNGALETLKMPQ